MATETTQLPYNGVFFRKISRVSYALVPKNRVINMKEVRIRYLSKILIGIFRSTLQARFLRSPLASLTESVLIRVNSLKN